MGSMLQGPNAELYAVEFLSKAWNMPHVVALLEEFAPALARRFRSEMGLGPSSKQKKIGETTVLKWTLLPLQSISIRDRLNVSNP